MEIIPVVEESNRSSFLDIELLSVYFILFGLVEKAFGFLVEDRD
jgi:hypothetical protein